MFYCPHCSLRLTTRGTVVVACGCEDGEDIAVASSVVVRDCDCDRESADAVAVAVAVAVGVDTGAVDTGAVVAVAAVPWQRQVASYGP